MKKIFMIFFLFLFSVSFASAETFATIGEGGLSFADSGTAESKIKAFEEAGVKVAKLPSGIVELL